MRGGEYAVSIDEPSKALERPKEYSGREWKIVSYRRLARALPRLKLETPCKSQTASDRFEGRPKKESIYLGRTKSHYRWGTHYIEKDEGLIQFLAHFHFVAQFKRSFKKTFLLILQIDDPQNHHSIFVVAFKDSWGSSHIVNR